MGDGGDLRGEMAGDGVWLEIVGEDYAERLLSVKLEDYRRQLGDDRIAFRNIELSGAALLAPMHPDRAGAVALLAPCPVLRPHMHAVQRTHLFRIGNDMDLMPE